MFSLHPQPPVTITTSAYMFTQVSHVSITSPDPCDKHNFRLYVHPSVTCFHYIPSSLWQAQIPPICSSKIRMLTSPAPCDKHNFRLYVHPILRCFQYIPSPLWQTQLLHICSPKCHMFPLHPQLHVTNTISSYRFTQLSHVSIISPAPCDKHNFRLYTHPCVSCFHYIPSSQWQTQLPPVCSPKCHMLNPSSLWQTQLPPVCSPKCHMLILSCLWQTQLPPVYSPMCLMFPLYPKLPVTNTTSTCMLTQVSHAEPQFLVTSSISSCMLA